MQQIVTIQWYQIDIGNMPDDEGTYLVAFSDGTVESFPMDEHDLSDGQIRAGKEIGLYWAYPIPHPDL